MKAVIPCAGGGTRLRPLTGLQPKALLPVANKPVIEYAIACLRDAGCREIGVVSNPEQRAAMAAALGDGSRWQVHLSHLTQTRGRGIAAALLAARPFLGSAPFATFLGDNLLEGGLAPAVARFARGDAAALLLLKEVADPRPFGVALLEGERITGVVEKPSVPNSRLAICGVYLFTPAVWGAIANLRPSARGELEITDAVAALIGAGETVVGHPLVGWWHDMGTWPGYLAANRAVLGALPAAPPPAFPGNRLTGPVQVGAGTVLAQCQITGPAVVGRDCILRRVEVGPYTSIGDGAVLEGVQVAESVILPGAHLAHLPWALRGAVVGPGSLLLTAAEPGRPAEGV